MTSGPGLRKFVRRRLAAGGALLAVFFGNMMIGKIRLLTQTGVAAPLDGVPEFLLLAAAVGCFVAALLAPENGTGGTGGGK